MTVFEGIHTEGTANEKYRPALFVFFVFNETSPLLCLCCTDWALDYSANQTKVYFDRCFELILALLVFCGSTEINKYINYSTITIAIIHKFTLDIFFFLWH